MFLFFAKNSQQNVFDHFLDILEKIFFKSHTCSDCIKNNKEQQAIPSFHSIHQVEFS